MTRVLASLIVIMALGSCTQRMICPAYQSAFVYDQEALRKKFSYFKEDSTPKILTASKNKYLIAEEVSYRKKLARMATVEMKDVQPEVPDSLSEEGDVSLAELDRAARSVIDSTFIVDIDKSQDSVATEEDSVYVITKDKEVRYLRFNKDSVVYNVDDIRLNVDQDNYMWYLRDWLVLPDVRLAKVQGRAKDEEATAKKEKKGFFKNLFKKKKKAPVDSTSTQSQAVPKSEFDFEYNDLESEAQPEDQTEVKKEKKGLFSFLKKKDKKPKEPKPPKEPKVKKEKKPKDEAAPEEEETPKEEPDDGF